MATVYVIRDDGSTAPMSRVLCKNEDRELQRILERNPDLLPGDQIKLDDPRRWLLLKREMPVPDPGTGTDRWSIDFLFADQDAIPTFVECKRCADTRARREIVGQMLEYAAFLTCYSNGDLTFNLFWLNGSELALHAQRRLKELAGKKLNLPPGAEDRPLAIDQWAVRSREVAEVVDELLSDCHAHQ